MRRIINSPDYLSIFPGARPDLGSNAVDHLVTQRGGGYWLAGVGSQLTGVGAHVLVGDDLIKSREVAESELEMSRIWDWFNSVAMTRLSPGGGVILMNTRWSPNDLAGRVLQADTKGRWKRLSFPALAVNEERSRRIGEPLHPERYTLEMLEEIRDQLIANGKEREWLALYQQSPVNIQGDFFKAEGLVYVPLAEFPKTDDLYWYIGTDFAASVDSRADDTALIPVGIDSEGNGYCPPDAVVEKLSILDSVERLLDLCEKYHPLWVAMEKGVLNSAIKPILAKRMSERGVYVTIKEITRSQGKHIYAAPVQARMQAKKVRFARTDLYMLKIAPSFLNFSPGATNQYDDPVDAISNIYMTLEGIVAPGPKVPEKEQSEEDIDDEMWEKILSRMRGKDAVPFAKFNGEKYAQKKEVVS